MFRYAIICLAILLATGCSPVTPLISAQLGAGKTVIFIVSDRKGIEAAVAKQLEWHFTGGDYTVANLLTSEFPDTPRPGRHIAIFLNALSRGTIPPDILDTLREESGDGRIPGHVFISTISGGSIDAEESLVDGVTAASELENAEFIAQRIIFNIQKRLERGPGIGDAETKDSPPKKQ
ncbi:MAG: hypothetical protein HUN04_24765 [Desulfobacter sp.]|nr:MAG: hypothetical protein HUN04_24765 [Desulfobacter sp.]